MTSNRYYSVLVTSTWSSEISEDFNDKSVIIDTHGKTYVHVTAKPIMQP